MNIKGVVQTTSGDYEVTVELNSAQHKFIFETGLRFLVASGAMPMAIEAEKIANIIVPEVGEDEKETVQ